MSTNKAGETKRQHYVPRFLLRNFSPDGRRISLVMFAARRRIDDASIKGQCYEDYFYGKDQVMEKSFAAEEGVVCNLLGDLSVAHLESITTDATEKLRTFVHYQRFRTLGSARATNAMIDAFAKAAVKGTLRPGDGISPEDIDRVQIGLTDAQQQSLWHAAGSTPLLLDLDVKFIVTDRTPGFIISDHPVVSGNQYAEHHPDFQHCLGITGLACKGLQMFLPVSPSVTLAVYDPTTYQYGGKGRVCRAGPDDVAYLNQMQATNALNCAYFLGTRITDTALATIMGQRAQHESVYSRRTMTSPTVLNPDGSKGQLVAVSGGEVRVGAKLSLIRLLDQKRYYGYDRAHPPVRSEKQLELARAFAMHLEKIVKQRRQERIKNDAESQSDAEVSDEATQQGPAPDGARSLASSAPRPAGEPQGVGPTDAPMDCWAQVVARPPG